MALSWNEIKSRAVTFSKEWAGTSNEEADAKPFLEDFFHVFGITRKRIAYFEHKVKKLGDASGYIDLFWKGTIVIEMKSLGKNLDKAFIQAKEYIHGLKEDEVPKYVLVSDFDVFRLFDTEEQKTIEFKLEDLVNNVQHFGFIAGYQKHEYKEQDPVNIKAAELMGKLHDKLKLVGYDGHALEVYLVRLLFCLFADDTTIFDKDIFTYFIEERTAEDGSDLAARLSELFYILNTSEEKRLKNLDEQLASFPYVNGKLFEETLPPAAFDTQMRLILLECCGLNWGKISPAIFGSMFQSVMNPIERRNLGAHYTSETNILKLIKPLFLDDLWTEFEGIKTNKNKLVEFHKKLSNLKFFDPACGCGNFLIITYRELRFLEIEILRAMNKSGTGFLDVREIIWLDVDMMFGIEYEEFPARIAEVAMWLMDHQMNMLISQEFGQYFVRLPLKKAATIIHGNALRVDWESVVPKEDLSFILGNPPFYGYSFQSKEQKEDMTLVFEDNEGTGILDYVTAWYLKSAKYIQNTKIKVGFVSTNSISQGEQVGVLWQLLKSKYGITINFAHRTFKWSNEANGKAAVHVVIIGFANFDVPNKKLYDYDNLNSEPHLIAAKNINPYLVDSKDVFIKRRTKPLCDVPEMVKGSSPTDGGHLLLDTNELTELLKEDPDANIFIKEYVGSFEFINGIKRYCLWLKDVLPEKIKAHPLILKRINEVKTFRELSTKKATRNWANYPSLFIEVRQPKSNYLLIPRVSSETRKYIPIGYLDEKIIVSDSAIALPNASLYHFGVLTSEMHMVWLKYTCGRLKSDFRYSNTIVYNNYPWPENISIKQKEKIEICAQMVLDARAIFPESTLADLYNPLTMPPQLTRAHHELNKAVDLAYRPQPFPGDTHRMTFLFELYEKYTADLFFVSSKKNKIRN